MIRRRYVHLFFVVASVCLLVIMGWQALKLRQQAQLTEQLAAVPESLASMDELDASTQPLQHPWVDLSVASALAQGDNLEQAERTLNGVIRDSSDAQSRTEAQYNLANVYLRQALASGTETSSKSLPLVQLAKQRYRDLLAEQPEHWPARYNLERALRMAPEGTDRTDDGRVDPVKSVDVIVPGFKKKELP